ncbi:MAG TPA: cation-translocating P-type ATPase, partial [Flavitalea sp.]|nr:cation-translocating P-type ATPase [Flavitalea sp.]
MEKVSWKVSGMTCSNCALTVHKFLEKKGMQQVKVNLAGGNVSFELNGNHTTEEITKGIQSLGYDVHTDTEISKPSNNRLFKNHLQRFLFCLGFTAPLLLHMADGWIDIHWLMNPWIQLGLCIPVYVVGMDFFGRSAIKSLRNGMPNMNVLIAVGSSAAFAYSLIGTLLDLGNAYLFYETAAAIITLVFFGNYLEDVSINSTQRELNKLARSQQVTANMITYDDQHQENIFQVENSQLRPGDLILIKAGEQVPADCKILWGEAQANESIISGESLPLHKTGKDLLIGGSVLIDGTVKAQVTAGAKDSVLSQIVQLVQQAQGEKPPVQQLADRISSIFVPVVLVITAVTFVVNFFVLNAFTPALMRSIAVLVIACPCAMGLATPAAIAVGMGRAARKGILFRNAKTLELFRNIRQVVFDKTGTLTTGKFGLTGYKITSGISEDEFRNITYSLEKYSNHPIAKSISETWKTKNAIAWKKVEEIKGVGMSATTKAGETYRAVHYNAVRDLTNEEGHNVYIVKDKLVLGWIDVSDAIRPEAATIIQYIKSKGLKTILLSGDIKTTTEKTGALLGIDEVIAEKSPAEKLAIIETLNASAPTAMVGDGINDAPALAKATIGISMSDSSQLAMQTADVI